MPTSVSITFDGQGKCCVSPDPVQIQSNGVIQWSCAGKKFKLTKLVDQNSGKPAHPFGNQFPNPGDPFRHQVTTPAAQPVTQRKNFKYDLGFEDGSSYDPIIIIDQ
jgi:hypothetical protein